MTGLAVNLSSISAQSYILTLVHAKYSLYTAVAVAGLFSVYQAKFALRKTKFAHFSTLILLGLSSLLFLVGTANHLNLVPSLAFAFAWLFVALLASDYFRWSLNELTMRHMDHASGSSHLSYVMMSFEAGSLVAAGTIFSRFLGFEPKQLIYVSCGIQLIIALFYWLQFGPVANLEVRFSRKPAPAPAVLKRSYSAILPPLLVLGLFAGMSRSTEDYVIRLAAITYSNSFASIQDLLSQVYALRGVLIIIVSLAVGRLTQSRRPSMISWIAIYLSSCLGVAAYCLVNPGIYSLVALSSLTRALERSLYFPSLYLISGAFVPPVRGRLRSLQHFVYFAVAGLLVAGWVAIMGPILEDFFEIKVMLTLFILFSAAALLSVQVLRIKLIQQLSLLMFSEHKPSAILAVHSLSFLKPKDFLLQMQSLLAAHPKPVLRKTIIEGLAYSKDSQAVPTILKEFETDKEMIQIAVLEGLRVAQEYSGIQFIINIAMIKGASRTPQVRLKALSMIGSFYGKKAIPFLLNGLNDQEERIVANSLEQLTLFQDRALIPYFRKHALSPVPRICVTGLLGLSSFSDTRQEFRSSIETLLRSNHIRKMASALYAVGYSRDFYFLPVLESLLVSPWCTHASVKATLAWALSSLRDPRGYELFASYFNPSTPMQDVQRVLHFMGQLPRDIRFTLFRRICSQGHHTKESIALITERLKNTHQDFHEEIDYIQELAA